MQQPKRQFKKQVIYEAKGRAREFSELAINLFTGCGHQCIYCYGADITHQSPEEFKNMPRPRVTEQELMMSAAEWASKGERRRVLLCFVTDPYQPVEAKTQLTRKAIEILHKAGLYVHILTKGGERSLRDFDLLIPGKDAYATTLTLHDREESLKWEPFAAPPIDRILALQEAHRLGIETWVSFEPVINPQAVSELLELTHKFVGHYKVGTMNYHPHGRTIDWKKFGMQIKRELDLRGASYYFKKDLLKEMGIIPANFHQTWVCR